MREIKIRNIEFDEILEAGNLIKKIFDENTASDYSTSGINYFYKVVNELSIRERFLCGSQIYIAECDNRLIGYIEMADLNHIYLLFVEQKFRNKKVGRMLIDFSIKSIIKNNPDVNRMTVNSTGNAVEFYQKHGFTGIADFQFKNGILSFPMSADIRTVARTASF